MRAIAVLAFLLTFSCSTLNYENIETTHIFLEPAFNRTPEEALDVILTQVLNDAFRTDPRFKVENQIKTGETILIKPTILSFSLFSVGYDERDRTTEYRLSMTIRFELYRAGYKKPFKVFTITRYGFYEVSGSGTEIEERKKECMKRVAREIMREFADKLVFERVRRK